MAMPELVLEQEIAVEEAGKRAVEPVRERAASDALEVPSCSAALSARSFEEQVVPI